MLFILFIIPYKVLVSLLIPSLVCVTNHVKAIEQHFHVVLFMRYKIILPCKSVILTLLCQSKAIEYRVVLSSGIVYYPFTSQF